MIFKHYFNIPTQLRGVWSAFAAVDRTQKIRIVAVDHTQRFITMFVVINFLL